MKDISDLLSGFQVMISNDGVLGKDRIDKTLRVCTLEYGNRALKRKRMVENSVSFSLSVFAKQSRKLLHGPAYRWKYVSKL